MLGDLSGHERVCNRVRLLHERGKHGSCGRPAGRVLHSRVAGTASRLPSVE